MNSKLAPRRLIDRLFEIRNGFGGAISGEKLALLEQLPALEVKTATDLLRLHSALSFIRAFPDTRAHHRRASVLLDSFAGRAAELSPAQRKAIRDSGVAGSPVHYAFSFHIARWLARRSPESVSIDWDEIGDTERLDELLQHVLRSAEDDYFHSGLVTSREWVGMAATGGEFNWLIGQLHEPKFRSVWAALYDAADLPLAWHLRGLRLVQVAQCVAHPRHPSAGKRHAPPAEGRQERNHAPAPRPRAGVAAICGAADRRRHGIAGGTPPRNESFQLRESG